MKKDFECAEESCTKEILRKKGMKSTAQRLAVVHVLHESGKSLSVDEIHRGVKEMLGGAGLATIYRTLETFENLGLVRRLHFPGGEHGYAFCGGQHVHHMVCLICRKIFDFPECPVENLGADPFDGSGFRVKDHFVQLFGECGICAESAAG